MNPLKHSPRRAHSALLSSAKKDVLYVQALCNYSKFFFVNGSSCVMSYSINNYTYLENFIRISRSHLVNKLYIKDLNLVSCTLKLFNDFEVKISKTRSRELMDQLGHK